MPRRVVLSPAHTREEEAAGSPEQHAAPGTNECQKHTQERGFLHPPQGAPGQGGSGNMFWVTFKISFLMKRGLFLAVILYKEHL